ncbi:MAG: carboxypeptidase-like regulatory domain-containing protein [Saprospiraceae bacterium]
MKTLLYFCIFVAGYFPLLGQNLGWTITGIVQDELGEALPGAVIQLDDSAQVITGSTGRFLLESYRKPRRITVRCVGYFAQRVALDTVPAAKRTINLKIVLLPSAVSLPEVAISSKPITSIFKEDFKTNLLDYVFAGTDLVLLVHEGKKHILRLTDDDGNLIASLQLPGEAERLHQSCTGDFHAVGETWAWEFTRFGQRLDTFLRYPAAEFHRIVEPCVLEHKAHYFFRKTGPFRQSVQYTYYDPDHKPHLLAIVRDEVAEAQLLRRYRGILAAYMRTIPDVDKDDIFEGKSPLSDPFQAINPDNLTKMAETNELITEIGFFSQLARDSLYAPLAKVGSELYLFDHQNDKLLHLVAPAWRRDSIPLAYHRTPGWKKELLVDAVLQRAYGRFQSSGGYLVLKEIDLQTGLARKTYRPAVVPFLAENFKIRSGVLYCIGQPDVNVPNRQLYKTNIFKFAE